MGRPWPSPGLADRPLRLCRPLPPQSSATFSFFNSFKYFPFPTALTLNYKFEGMKTGDTLSCSGRGCCMATPTTQELTADSEPSPSLWTLTSPHTKAPALNTHTPRQIGSRLSSHPPLSSHLQHKEDLQERVIPELELPVARGPLLQLLGAFSLRQCPRILCAPTMVGLASTLRSTAQDAPGISSQYSSENFPCPSPVCGVSTVLNPMLSRVILYFLY